MTLAQQAVKQLKARHKTLVTAESCTGGWIAKRITDIAGASEVFECGIVCYSNRIKTELLGVRKETLAEFGAVSEQTAREMALGALDVSKAGFFFYYSMPEEKNIRSEVVSREKSGRTFCPTKDFRLPLEMADFFSMKPTIWSAIYRTAFIRENGIRFLETPGASYQDAGFNFKVLLMAEKMISNAFSRCINIYPCGPKSFSVSKTTHPNRISNSFMIKFNTNRV